jgi:acyl-coenzyme A thioesterase PaaI-like protein
MRTSLSDILLPRTAAADGASESNGGGRAGQMPPRIRVHSAREATIMDQRTHDRISAPLCGKPVELEAGRARVELETTRDMAADDRGLVHGGFTFGLADYAAMLAVNEPTVVLGSAQVKFLGPVVAGDRLEAEAVLDRSEGRKRFVKVTVRRNGAPVLEGELLAVVPDSHILDVAPRK